MASDIFRDDDTLDIFVASMLSGQDKINLGSTNIETYIIPYNYTVQQYNFSNDRSIYPRQIRDATSNVVSIAEGRGCNPNLFTALYEAILNAHQHGNLLDKNKNVTLAYKIDPTDAEIGIIDEGGLINPAFIGFVNRHRIGKHKERFLDWYTLSGQEKPKTNNGTGTSFMHTYVDNVQYFKSDKGGLVCHLTKRW